MGESIAKFLGYGYVATVGITFSIAVMAHVLNAYDNYRRNNKARLLRESRHKKCK